MRLRLSCAFRMVSVLMLAASLEAADHGREQPTAEEPRRDVPATKEQGGGTPKAEGDEARKEQLAEIARQEGYTKAVEAGRAAFAKRNYAEALVHFREAVTLVPTNHYAALLAGIAAYWNREPRVAMEQWTPLAERAQKNSPEEWEATRHLVLAWHALNDDARAEECVRRLYDLRSKARLPQAMSADGFTRQHLWLGTRRIGVWEVFDERGEQSKVWQFHVMETKDGEEKVLSRLSLEVEPRSDGTPGYALVEEGAPKRVYKRWPAKPTYLEARAAAVAAVKGQLKYLDAGTPEAGANTADRTGNGPKTGEVAGPVTGTPEATKAARAPDVTKMLDPTKRESISDEEARMAKVLKLKLSPAATRILAVVARLAGVNFDVSRYVRLSLTDPAAARQFEKAELSDRYPRATEDASDLVQFTVAAKPAELQETFRNLAVAMGGTKGDYARFVLLTALNTRDSDIPADFLAACLGSEDFVVRETAALLMGRGGRKEGLEALFKELAAAGDGQVADETARVISFPLEELLGSVLGSCPAQDSADWREAALAWWKQNEAKLGYLKGAPAGQPVWRPVK